MAAFCATSPGLIALRAEDDDRDEVVAGAKAAVDPTKKAKRKTFMVAVDVREDVEN
jgi:hypothetical protein